MKLCMVALPHIRCQLHDHARQYDKDEVCHNKRNGGKLHGNISRSGYGNARIGRYGGCFEEGIWWVHGIGESSLVRVSPKQTVFNPFPRRHLEPSPSECGR